MDFFERLRQATFNKFKGIFDLSRCRPPYSDGYLAGVNDTIAALKEMMVGEPIKGSIRHGSISYTTKPLNTTVLETAEGSLRIARDHHDTDGEEVAVLVVRL